MANCTECKNKQEIIDRKTQQIALLFDIVFDREQTIKEWGLTDFLGMNGIKKITEIVKKGAG